MKPRISSYDEAATGGPENRCKWRVVTLFGLDGAGKTTLAEMTVARLSSLGIDAVYARPKFGERPHKRVTTHLQPDKPSIKNRSSSFPSRMIDAVILPCLLLEHYMANAIEIAEPVGEGKCVVAERSWPDTLVDLVVDFRIPYNVARTLVRPSKSKRNECLVFLDVPRGVAMNRKPGPYDVEYLSRRESAYRTIVRDLRVHSINTSQNPQTALNEIIELLEAE
ncbi:MAG: hypothetical protein JSV90_09065 [Methanobacteriota archaeon]|nr:MAG: hypothetical protein JSV90_09065 [Euryarchaeota archaeon]